MVKYALLSKQFDHFISYSRQRQVEELPQSLHLRNTTDAWCVLYETMWEALGLRKLLVHITEKVVLRLWRKV